jgi:phosphonoacetaldehyde hydrolase
MLDTPSNDSADTGPDEAVTDHTPLLTGLLVDWAGTIVDFGSRAPIVAFLKAFEESSVPISESEARAPMGMAKWEHIEAVLKTERVSQAWKTSYGRPWTHTDVDMIYERFLPLQAKTAERFSSVIPGAVAALSDARQRGMKVGSTSGYPQAVMDTVIAEARAQGLTVDACACAGDTRMGRPMPFMLYKVLLELELGAVWRCVVVDDTPVGIEAARNAGTWAVGVTISGNEVGLSPEDWMALDKTERERLRRRAADSLRGAGAHFVIDSIAGLSAVLTRLEDRLARGERP